MRHLALLLPLLLGACSPPLTPELGPPPRAGADVIAVAPLTPARQRREPRIQRVLCGGCGERRPRASSPPACACGSGEVEPVRRAPGGVEPRLDGAAVAARAAALLAERGGFSRAVALPEPAATDPQARGLALRDAARAAGARWLLEPTLQAGGEVLYLGQSAPLVVVKVVNLILCAFLIFPAVDPPNWFIASESYALDLEATWSLVDLRGGAPGQGSLEVWAERAVAEFGLGLMAARPWFLIGFMRVPGCLDAEDWADIGAELAPDAEESLARSLTLAAEEARQR